MTRGEWHVGAFVPFGVVDEAKLEGIDLELVGQLVHASFESVEAGDGARSAHVHGRADVAMDEAAGDFEVGDAVEVRRGLAAAFVVVVELAGDVEVVVAQGEQLAFGGGSELDVLLGAWPVADI
jgi:hypothetical protein